MHFGEAPLRNGDLENGLNDIFLLVPGKVAPIAQPTDDAAESGTLAKSGFDTPGEWGVSKTSAILTLVLGLMVFHNLYGFIHQVCHLLNFDWLSLDDVHYPLADRAFLQLHRLHPVCLSKAITSFSRMVVLRSPLFALLVLRFAAWLLQQVLTWWDGTVLRSPVF